MLQPQASLASILGANEKRAGFLGTAVSSPSGAPRHSHVSSPPTLQPLTPEGALPIRVEHDVHEECGNGRQRVGVQAGDTEPVARARQWVDDRPLDCEGTKTRDAEAGRRGALWARWRLRKRGEVHRQVLWGGPAAGPVRLGSCRFSSSPDTPGLLLGPGPGPSLMLCHLLGMPCPTFTTWLSSYLCSKHQFE